MKTRDENELKTLRASSATASLLMCSTPIPILRIRPKDKNPMMASTMIRIIDIVAKELDEGFRVEAVMELSVAILAGFDECLFRRHFKLWISSTPSM